MLLKIENSIYCPVQSFDEITFKVIARIRSDFPDKFGIPRQSGLLKNLRSTIVFEPEFRNADALRGLEGFSHLWLLWIFSENVRDTWYARPVLVAIRGWACLRRAAALGRIPWP